MTNPPPPDTPLPDAIVDAYHAPPQPAAKRPSLAKRLLPFAKLLISLGLIAWILSTAQLSEVWASLRGVDPWPLALAFALLPLGVVFGALRWQLLLRAQGVHASFAFLYGSNMVAAFVSKFLPSTIGGDAFRAYDSWRSGARKSVALATVGVDRLLGLLALALFAAGAVVISPGLEGDGLAVLRACALAGAAALLVVTAWIFLPDPPVPGVVRRLWTLVPALVRRPFDKLLGALSAFTGRHGALAAGLALSVLLQVNVVLFYWLIAHALALPVSLAHMFFLVPIATFVMMVPISINGIGLREGAWIGLLALHAVDKAPAVALAWIEYALMLAFGLIGGIVYAARK